jgi:hypothetical protein
MRVLTSNPKEIEQIKLKVREHAWAARLLDRAKATVEQDGAAVEASISYALSGEARYARIVRERLVGEARDQLRHDEKLDVKAEPEWGRWTWWGATAWAYDLAYDAFTPEKRGDRAMAPHGSADDHRAGKSPDDHAQPRLRPALARRDDRVLPG